MLSEEIILIFDMPLSSPRLYKSQWKVNQTLIPEGARSPRGGQVKGGLEDSLWQTLPRAQPWSWEERTRFR